MPTLRELDASFKRCLTETSAEKDENGMYVFRDSPGGDIRMWSPRPTREVFETVDELARADGLWFDCPKCWAAWKAGAERGPHAVLIWFEGRGAPAHIGKNSKGERVRWNIVSGTGLDDLHLSPSILLEGDGCGWHGFIGHEDVPAGHAA
jgi:hypothetical protein